MLFPDGLQVLPVTRASRSSAAALLRRQSDPTSPHLPPPCTLPSPLPPTPPPLHLSLPAFPRPTNTSGVRSQTRACLCVRALNRVVVHRNSVVSCFWSPLFLPAWLQSTRILCIRLSDVRLAVFLSLFSLRGDDFFCWCTCTHTKRPRVHTRSLYWGTTETVWIRLPCTHPERQKAPANFLFFIDEVEGLWSFDHFNFISTFLEDYPSIFLLHHYDKIVIIGKHFFFLSCRKSLNYSQPVFILIWIFYYFVVEYYNRIMMAKLVIIIISSNYN